MSTPVRQIVKETLDRFPTLYDYQLEAVWQAISRTRKTNSKLLLVLPTAAGKSFIIAAISACLKNLSNSGASSGKRILVLAPGEELVEQNSEKLVSHGFNVSVFCDGLKQKDLEHDIVFGSAMSVLNSIDQFKDHDFAAVILDEAHSTPPTVQQIIDALSVKNQNLRVIGTTATPYRLGRGYIYKQNTYRGFDQLPEDLATDPFFDEVVFDISPHDLIERGKIVPPTIGSVTDYYDTQGLRQTQTGKWDSGSEKEVFVEGKSQLTKRIVDDLVRKSKKRNGVMIFAQNIEHAEMVLSLLPKNQAQLITSHTKKKDRKEFIQQFRTKKLKYLVNVGTLTTGFDAPVADVIAMLRTTESASLFQQILGRGIRLCPEIGKRDCLLLDYAQNIERFAPDGDLFTPEITAARPGAGGLKLVEVTCPTCAEVNHFRPITAPVGTVMNEQGFLVLGEEGNPVLSQDGQLVSGHLGSQCRHYHETNEGNMKRCPQQWSSRLCDRCGTLNPQSARFCRCCHEPLTEKGKRMGDKAFSNPDALYSKRVAKVLRMWWVKTLNKHDKEMLKVTFEVQELPKIEFDDEGNIKLKDEEPSDVTVWVSPHIKHPKAQEAWSLLINGCAGGGDVGVTEIIAGKAILEPSEFITYRLLPPQSQMQAAKFYEISAYENELQCEKNPA